MQAFGKHCIFCGRELTGNEKRSKGDHIVPRLLYGILCMKDVCRTCDSLFGSKADIPALKDPFVVGAAFHLDLPELQNRIKDANPAYLEDRNDGRRIPAKSKGGEVRMEPGFRRKDYFEAPSDYMLKHRLPNHFRKFGEQCGVPEEEIRAVTEKAKKGIPGLALGDEYHVPETGDVFRVGKTEAFHEISSRIGAIDRLIAKIAYELVWLVTDDGSQMALKADLDKLRDLALHGTNPDRPMILRPRSLTREFYSPNNSDYVHHLQVEWEANYLRVIINLFGNIRHIIPLFPCVGGTLSPPLWDGTPTVKQGFGMRFKPGERPEKFKGYCLSGSAEWVVLNGDGL